MFSTLAAIAFPTIDPVLIQIGPLAIRWYALAYIAGILIGWRLVVSMADAPGSLVTRRDVDDFMLWATIGVVLGGRLGYVLLYRPGHYLQNPMEALAMWHGGMSFHGGMIGVVAALYLFSHFRKLPQYALHDLVAVVTPIGLFFGRIANFINGELWGRVSDVPWAMVFPNGGPEPRHPSQLYQAALEGLILFAVLWFLRKRVAPAYGPGFLSGAFLVGYAIARMIGELFRQPDWFLGFLPGGTTMGQLLSVPMAAFGIYLIWRSAQVKQPA